VRGGVPVLDGRRASQVAEAVGAHGQRLLHDLVGMAPVPGAPGTLFGIAGWEHAHLVVIVATPASCPVGLWSVEVAMRCGFLRGSTLSLTLRCAERGWGVVVTGADDVRTAESFRTAVMHVAGRTDAQLAVVAFDTAAGAAVEALARI